MNVEEAHRSLLALNRAMAGNPFTTISGARSAYLRGDIDVSEFEDRVEAILRGRLQQPS